MLFEAVITLKPVLFGFGLDSDNIHRPNEKYGVFNYLQGLRTIPRFFANYAAMMNGKA